MRGERDKRASVELKGLIASVIASILTGINFIVPKLGLSQGIEPVSFGLVSCLVSVIVLAIIAVAQRRPIPTAAQAQSLAAVGLFAGAASFFLFLGLQVTTAMNTNFLYNLAVAATVLFSFILLRERLSAKQFVAIALMLLGAFFVTTRGSNLVLQLGDSYVLIAALFFGLSNTLAKGAMGSLDSLTASLWRSVFAGFFLFAAAVVLSLSPFSALGVHSVVSGVILALTLWALYYSFDKLGASRGAALFLLNLLFGTAFAWLFLAESLSVVQAFGGLLILAGAVAINVVKR